MHASDRLDRSGARVHASGAVAAVAVLLGLLFSAPLVAQDPKKDAREREAMRRLQVAQGELQRVTRERDELVAERDAGTAKAQKLEQSAASAQSALAAERRRSASELSALRAELDELRKRSEASVAQGSVLADRVKLAAEESRVAEARQRDLTTQVESRGAEQKRVVQELAASRRAFAQCEAVSGKLHAFGLEMLDRHARVSVLDAARRNEPFVGIKRVELENMIEAYRDRLEAARAVTTSR